jgi:phage portal protein BeeE
MFTLRPWLVLLESAFSALIPAGQYIKFNSDALVRADLKTRWEVNQIRLTVGAASINEIRAQEDEQPIPGGDKYATPAAAAPAGPAPPSQPDTNQQDQPAGDVTPIRRIQ